MKKVWVTAILSAAMIAALAGCGSDSADSSSSSPAGTSSASVSSGTASEDTGTDAASGTDGSGSGANIKLAMIVSHTDEHFKKVIAGAEAYEKEHPDVEVDIQSPTSATAYDEQMNMIETTLSNESYDGYMISPLQSDSVAQLVAGVTKPVIAFNADFDAKEKVAFVGTGNEKAAKSGGEEAVKEAEKNGVKGSDIKAVILTGAQGDETHESRMKGYKDAIEAAGGEIVEVQYCDSAADKAANAMEGVMQKYPDGVDIVCVTDDNSSVSAARVVYESGLDSYKNTVICGFDGTSAGVNAIKKGMMSMDVAQLGYDMGYKAVETCVAAVNGEKVDSVIDSGSEVVTKDNVDEYISEMKKLGVYEEN